MISIPSHCCSVCSKKSITASARLLQPTSLLPTGLSHQRTAPSPVQNLPLPAMWPRQNSLTTCYYLAQKLIPYHHPMDGRKPRRPVYVRSPLCTDPGTSCSLVPCSGVQCELPGRDGSDPCIDAASGQMHLLLLSVKHKLFV